jgi:hypothetical protein
LKTGHGFECDVEIGIVEAKIGVLVYIWTGDEETAFLARGGEILGYDGGVEDTGCRVEAVCSVEAWVGE